VVYTVLQEKGREGPEGAMETFTAKKLTEPRVLQRKFLFVFVWQVFLERIP